MILKLILDRFEADKAVCELLEAHERIDGEEAVPERLELDRRLFPPETKEGDLFLWHGARVTLLPEETAARREALEERFSRLFKRD